LESLVYQNEKLLKESADKIPEDKKAPIEALIEEGKKSLESNDPEQIKSVLDRIMNDKNLQEAVAAMYAEAQAQTNATAGEAGAEQGAESSSASAESSSASQGGYTHGGETSTSEENVVDADFEVVDEDKDSK
jgi:molecular chaperone DnaK